MPDIDISLNGLLKLLKNLKPGKAAGPDKLKPLLLKELRDEKAPIIKVIFDKSLQTGTLPTEWLTANVMPVFQGRIQDFWEGGSNPSRGGSFSTFYLIFHIFPHEIEIICFQRGVQANHPNPL